MMDGAKSQNKQANKIKNTPNDKTTANVNNCDIRSFFNKSAGPSTLSTNKRIIKVIQPYINEIDENNYKLRERKIINYKTKFDMSDDSNEEDDPANGDEKNSLSEDKSNDNSDENDIDANLLEEDGNPTRNKKRKAKSLKKSKNSKKKQKTENDNKENLSQPHSRASDESSEENISEIDFIELNAAKSFQKFKSEAYQTILEAEQELKRLTKEFYINEQRISETKSKYPDQCIPIRADIREFKFKNLADKQLELTGQLFDIIMMDPPWQLSSSQPTRGVAIAYDTLNDSIITDIPVTKLQTDGFIFIWTINAKFKVTLDLLKQWGYK